MKMLKTFLVILFLLLFFVPETVHAEGELDDQTEVIDQMLDSSSGGFLSENELSVENAEAFTKITPENVFSWVAGQIRAKIKAPFALMTTLLAIVFLSSITENMCTVGKINGSGKVGSIVCVIVSISAMLSPVSDCFLNAGDTLEEGGLFMLAYVPVMASVMTASGNITAAGSYNLIVLGVSELSVQIASGFLVPMLGLCFSVSIVDALNPGLSLGGLINGLKKIITVLLGFIMTVFVGMLSVQNIVGGSVDSLSVKTGKYLVSNFVPVIGGAVSDAYSTVRGSLSVLKGGIGSVGIVALLLMVMPAVINLFLYRFAIGVAAVTADILSADRLKTLLKNIEMIFGIIISIVSAFIIMLIISTVIVMKMGSGI